MELKADSFTGAPQLRTLNLSRNNISVVHRGAFAGIEMLEELDLSFNEISVSFLLYYIIHKDCY